MSEVSDSVELNEDEREEKAKALDADSSKDLKALFADHSSDKSNRTTVKPVPTKYVHSTQKSSSKRSSKGQTAMTNPLTGAVMQPVESLVTGYEPSKSGSFAEASLGDINPTVPVQQQMASVVGNVSPQATSVPSAENEENVTEKVSYKINKQYMQGFIFQHMKGFIVKCSVMCNEVHV